jgi:hypothetical protein
MQAPQVSDKVTLRRKKLCAPVLFSVWQVEPSTSRWYWEARERPGSGRKLPTCVFDGQIVRKLAVDGFRTSQHANALVVPSGAPLLPSAKARATLRERYWRMQGRRTKLLPRSFFNFMRNLNSSPRGQRDECLEFQEFVARRIAARVGLRQPTHLGFVGRRTRSDGQRSSGESLERQKCK